MREGGRLRQCAVSPNIYRAAGDQQRVLVSVNLKLLVIAAEFVRFGLCPTLPLGVFLPKPAAPLSRTGL